MTAARAQPEAPQAAARREPRRAPVVGLIAVSLVVAVAGGARFGVLTDVGRRLIEAELDGASFGRLGRIHVDGLSGDVWSDFSVRRLTVSDAHGAWLDASNIRMRWNALQLLRRRLDVEEITATRIAALRRPVLSAPTRGGAALVSVHLGHVAARLEMAPAFSTRYGLYDVSGALDQQRLGGLAGRVSAASLTHAGDRLDAAFDLGRNKTILLDVQAHEAQGGALAGALGLAANQPFFIAASARGTTSQGRFQLTSRSGALVPVEAAGAWSPGGGQAAGRITLAASRLLAGYQAMLGTEARFNIAGTKAADGFYDLTLGATSDNVDLAARGEADLGRQLTGPKGMAVTLAARSTQRILSWPQMGPARFSGTLTDARAQWRLAGGLAVDQPAGLGYRLARAAGPAELAWRAGELTLGLNLAGDGGQGSGLLAALLGGRPHGAAQITWLNDGRLLLKSLAVTGPGLKVTGDGERGVFGALTFKGQASFSNLAAARSGAKGLVTTGWSASQAGGKPWAFAFDATAKGFASGLGELDRLLGAAPRLKGEATYDGHGFGVTHANLSGAAGDVGAAGLIGNDGTLKLALDWRAKGPFEAGPLEIAGAVNGSGALSGTLADPRADLDATFQSIDLPGLTLTQARVTLSFLKGPADTNGAFTLAAASGYGPARADAGFRFVKDGLDLTGLNAAAGGAHAVGAVSLRSGSPSSADLTVTLGPGAFLTRGEAAGRLVIVDAPGGPRASLKATATNVSTGAGVIVTTASLAADGPLGKLPYRLQASGFTEHGSWRAAGSGALVSASGDYDATFEGSGRLRNADFKTLAPAELKLGHGEQSLKLLADVGGGRAQVDARQSGQTFQARADLSDVSLGLLDQDYTGRFDASLSLDGVGPRLGGALDAKLAGAGQRGDKGAATLDGVVKAELAGDTLTLDATLGNAAGLASHGHFVLPAAASAAPFRVAIARTRPMSGSFSAKGEVKPLWDLIMGGERSLAGEIQAQGTLAGTLADPRTEGVATIANGQFNDADTGLKLRSVSLSARLADNAVDVGQFAGADAAGGTVSGAGRISLLRAGASSFRLDLKGFRLIDNDIATAVASGQATINRGADGKVKLAGALTIDRADVAANPPTPSGVTPMDVVEINRQPGAGGHLQTVSTNAPAVDLDVALKAPGKVFLKGRGLNVELSLDAHVTGSTASPALSGTARVVRGDYDFAGKRFDFDNRGVIYLASAPERIRLDLTATRDDPALTAVIRIEGTAARPTITLTSSPVLPNDEVLSQVLFGTSAAQLSPAEGAELASALVELRGGGGFDVLGNLRNFAHLDRLALGSGAGGASDVNISGGKYLTDKVYLELSGGGREGASAEVDWRVRHDLSVVARGAGAQGDSRVSIRWRKDYN